MVGVILATSLSCALFVCAVMQHVHWYASKSTWQVCIDLHYLSTALCSRMQSSWPAQDNRREPSVSKFSFLWRNTAAAAAIINGPFTSQPSLPSLRPGPCWWRDCVFSSPVPLWLNRPHSPAGLFWRTETVYCNDLSSVICFCAGILSSCPQLRDIVI